MLIYVYIISGELSPGVLVYKSKDAIMSGSLT